MCIIIKNEDNLFFILKNKNLARSQLFFIKNKISQFITIILYFIFMIIELYDINFILFNIKNIMKNLYCWLGKCFYVYDIDQIYIYKKLIVYNAKKILVYNKKIFFMSFIYLKNK